ncbi:peptidoglycan editing factor PgeF [Candidatus Tisiphia endosymbiont of Nemotelus uliginosus]|uniref:peptidoglycan editing factor PgeF n=1 Tax=Candidatus Tisiphia endosymbiont of Nemotelus uliginosus TaxID=3077926 RepID=UPI0035C91DA1
MDQLIKNKVYYKIFDLSFKHSSHIYSKKNDDPQYLDTIHQNRTAIINYYNATNIVILKQVHGVQIIDADLIGDFTTDLEGDGAITTNHNLVLAIQTADCVPILLTSSDGNIIGAAHCGWKGSKAGIVASIVTRMQAKGAKDIYAVIGPCIQQYSYEVNEEFYNHFIKDKAIYEKFFIPSWRATHYMFDLPAYVKLQLQEIGVKNIHQIVEDTYTTKLNATTYNNSYILNYDTNITEPRDGKMYKYPSYRRCCHTGELYNSAILSTIIKR